MNNHETTATTGMHIDNSVEQATRREALAHAHPRYRHWEFLLAVEHDLETCSRYVDVCSNNYNAHSIEFSSLILKSCTEIEKLCKRITGTKRGSDFTKFIRPLTELYPEFAFFCVDFPLWDIQIMPWDTLQTESSVPLWWTCYNKIKHDEKEAREAGNLWVCLNAVAGLYVTTLYYEIFVYPFIAKSSGSPRIILKPWMTPKYMQPDNKLVKRGINWSGEFLLDWEPAITASTKSANT